MEDMVGAGRVTRGTGAGLCPKESAPVESDRTGWVPRPHSPLTGHPASDRFLDRHPVWGTHGSVHFASFTVPLSLPLSLETSGDHYPASCFLGSPQFGSCFLSYTCNTSSLQMLRNLRERNTRKNWTTCQSSFETEQAGEERASSTSRAACGGRSTKVCY